VLRLSTFPTDVAGVLLTGFSTASSAVVSATNTVLQALGQLQAQVSLRAPLANPAFTGNGSITGFWGVGNNTTQGTAALNGPTNTGKWIGLQNTGTDRWQIAVDGATSNSATGIWAASTAYALNAVINNGANCYKVTTAGTSGTSGGPTGTGTGITDGTVTWAYVGPANQGDNFALWRWDDPRANRTTPFQINRQTQQVQIASGVSVTGGTATDTLSVSGAISGAGFTSLLAPYALTANVPAPATVAPIIDGTATVGVSALYARQDHVHPTDTTRYAASNPSGYQTAAQVAAVAGSPSSTTPLADGTAAVGTGTTWARADHVHPTDTTRYAASNPSGYQTAAQVTAALPVASSTTPAMNGTAAVGTGTTWARADHVHPSDTTRLPIAGGTMTGALTLAADPASALQAATRQYIDARVATTISANNTFANTTYSSIFPGVTFNDGWEATNIITSTSTALSQYTAIAGYIRNQHAQTSGGNQNGVALFGAATAEVNGAAVWGVNTLLQDSASRTAGTGTGRILIGYEVDFNVMNPGTQVIGCSVGGNGLAQPGNANGFIVNTLGSGIKWSGGFVTEDGAANFGISIGASSPTAGANFASQMMAFGFYDFNSTKQSATIQVTSVPGISEGNLVLSGSTLMALTVNNGNINMSSGSSFLTIGGNAVVGARVTGWGTASNGSPAAFNAATATAQQTASAVAYVIQSLFAHGLIGP
jgi:hypothetical protein